MRPFVKLCFSSLLACFMEGSIIMRREGVKSEGGVLHFLSLELGGGSNFVTRIREGCSYFCYARNAKLTRNQCNKTQENGLKHYTA